MHTYTKQNDVLLAQLREQQDQLHIARPITHIILFRDMTTIEAFQEKALALGFAIADFIEDPAISEYTLAITRTDALADGHIHSVTQHLLRMCEQHEAQYNGWETEIVTAGDETEKP